MQLSKDKRKSPAVMEEGSGSKEIHAPLVQEKETRNKQKTQ